MNPLKLQMTEPTEIDYESKRKYFAHLPARSKMKETEDEIDLTTITCNIITPTLLSITRARREISKQLQTRVCADPRTHDHGHSYIVWDDVDWLKKKEITHVIVPPTNPGEYTGATHNAHEIHKTKLLAWKRYKLAQAATKKMIMHAFKDYHFLELQDDKFHKQSMIVETGSVSNRI
ncbi:hypothetical protein FRACYDRAFT_237920 [Fragilariopsis cylindrus CCMP1102]|uniref:Uncharacterized protein n=1 Tax=Fragilariopsis cylindrus CCMP1102 TaxID=635003 RepID=A0A1E7FI96_9STRA|nr:hypothetical protein FRACYDRAFT_237920 [Fragilariopsis cylindrus CCMP1102]|eukprot:OEU17503.1 hypothetical protein FRACYDRAFT_237920 [Fragilariopsis cylindrus CCMP1102]